MVPSESPVCRDKAVPMLLLSAPLDAVPPRSMGGDFNLPAAAFSQWRGEIGASVPMPCHPGQWVATAMET